MRYHRVRFTKPKLRTPPKRVMKVLEGVGVYRQNRQGIAARTEAMAEQRRRQQSLCPNCNQYLEWNPRAIKFESKEFRDGEINRIIHRRCPKIGVV